MVAVGMMKMATGDDFPLQWSAGMGSRLVFSGYRGLRWQKFPPRVTPRVFGIFGDLWGKEGVREATEVGTTHQGALRPPGAPRWVVPPSGHPSGTSLAHRVPSGPEKIQKVLLRLYSVWY